MAEFLIEKEADENWVLSPDGSTIHMACNDGYVRSYEAETGKLIGETFLGGDLDAIAVSPDGSTLVVSFAGLTNESGTGAGYTATAQIALLDLTSPDIITGEYYFGTFDVAVSGEDRGIADLAISDYGEVLLSLHSVSETSASLFSFDLGSMTLNDLGDVAGDGTALSLTPTSNDGIALVGELGQEDSQFSLVTPDGFTFSDNSIWAPGELDFSSGVDAVSGSTYDGYIAVFADGQLKVFDKEFYLLGTVVSYDGISGEIAALAFGADGSTLYALDNLAGTITTYAISIDEFEGPQIVENGSIALNELVIDILPYGIEMAISPDGTQALLNTTMGIVSIDLGGGGGDPANSDDLVGTSGNDILDGGDGADVMTGLLGDDTYYVDNFGDRVIEGLDEGDDTVITSLASYTLPDNVENVDVTGDADTMALTGNALDNIMDISAVYGSVFTASGLAGDDTIDVSGLLSFNVYSPTWTITLNGNEGSDTLVGNVNGNNALYGGDDADQLFATGNGSNILDGGAGADVLDGSGTTGYTYFYVDDVNDIVIPGTGTQSYSGNPTNYLFVAAPYFEAPLGIFDITFEAYGVAQTIVGNEGTNHFRSMEALDTAVGGGGNDYYYVDSPLTSIVEEADGGYDRISFFGNGDYYIPIHVEEASIRGSISTLHGNDQDNFLTGQDGTFIGGLGNDTYRVWDTGTIIENAGEGIDTVLVSYDYTLGDNLENLSYREFLFANGRTLTGNEVANIITGSNGNETLSGLDGNDTIYADVEGSALSSSTHANDTVYGGSGNDHLHAVYGNDALYGEAGWDTLSSGAGDDLLDGGNGTDTASYASASSGVTVDLTIAGVQDTVGAGSDTLVSIERLVGSAHDDVLSGAGSATMIHGGAGADTITGGGSSDLFFGEDGSDTLNGGDGWDQLNGGDGDDVMVGGNGGDLFKGGLGDDTIHGDDGTDRAYLDDGNDVAFGGADNDLLNGQAGDDQLLGEDGDDELVGSSGADMLDGGADNDTLNGGGQNDVLIGGAGDDVLIGSWSVDSLTGGTGADTFLFETGHTGRWMGNADTITDFNQSEGDVIDLSAIDAIIGGGDDAFTFIGNTAFSGTAGELAFYVDGDATYVAGDTNGDGVADFQIRLEGQYDLSAGDFVL
ncbi:calcium-binding protein [Qipengyuania vesicularis]|uniref:calcium-binding protein n=1 Tax=Qipengyuania vesicularis TaxID=2867232 RepID=UPI001C870B40|nr:calcium-binding protein [Qipengyuania vesicularis]MBX7526625.1 type I secretion C-terminal target domain-containing protein [Qipengyuania vesicularis]